LFKQVDTRFLNFSKTWCLLDCISSAVNQVKRVRQGVALANRTIPFQSSYMLA
jgi:hypothetical protein